jgi:CheY-like chemotaxis protein
VRTRTEALRVVVIEDAPDLADLLKDMLEGEGHQVSVATDGIAGLALIRATRPHIVVCDIGLPGFDGHEVARAVRDDPALAGTHLIALSGWTQPQEIARARASGFESVLTKPVGVDLVLDEVTRAASA